MNSRTQRKRTMEPDGYTLGSTPRKHMAIEADDDDDSGEEPFDFDRDYQPPAGEVLMVPFAVPCSRCQLTPGKVECMREVSTEETLSKHTSCSLCEQRGSHCFWGTLKLCGNLEKAQMQSEKLLDPMGLLKEDTNQEREQAIQRHMKVSADLASTDKMLSEAISKLI
ncbi:hypothetical protein SERLADRAFT_411081 [Serpula lacrymans var. lacrymans S7.9]|uniref:Uncharacterized protein n=1 Tax=Serpula lacrymans var. lacrymans (strain S7.9) TaxID=578457 RepID=F8P8Y1_SERL9|nr:uncharacterized protein SERLADRAFT_411081 [Serpula lacrymans var. lacrymans S7.9]EGO20110.1 hypothetical protein SERLADRAFT_411081 [Serpula lacrymans var. lacrymans S7.9]